MTFIFHKYKIWWKSLSQMKLLSINNHSLTYEVIPHCAECVFLLFFVINALGMLGLPVPVHVQSNTNKNVYWAWLLRKSVFVVLGWKGTTQAEKSRYPEQGNMLHCETLDSVLDCASGDNGKVLWRNAEPPASSLFHVWFLAYLIPRLALNTSLYSLTSVPPSSPLTAAAGTRVLSDRGTQGCPGLDFLSDINSQRTMWERLGWRWATEVPLLLAVHQQRAVVLSWHGETAFIVLSHRMSGDILLNSFLWIPGL